jgi:hypothetical protein
MPPGPQALAGSSGFLAGGLKDQRLLSRILSAVRRQCAYFVELMHASELRGRSAMAMPRRRQSDRSGSSQPARAVLQLKLTLTLTRSLNCPARGPRVAFDQHVCVSHVHVPIAYGHSHGSASACYARPRSFGTAWSNSSTPRARTGSGGQQSPAHQDLQRGIAARGVDAPRRAL